MAAKTDQTAPAVDTEAAAMTRQNEAGAASGAAEAAAERDAKAAAGETPLSPADIAASNPAAVADPAPAAAFVEASGAIVEPEILGAVDLTHEAIDANPRANTTAMQNAIDLNDAKRANPHDLDFAGQGIDLSVYGSRGVALPDQTVATGTADGTATVAARPRRQV